MKTHILTDKEWRKLRNAFVNRTRRRHHLMEVNPGAEYNLRFDTVMSVHEVGHLIEDIITATERACCMRLAKESK